MAATYVTVNVKATSLLQRRLNCEQTTVFSETSRVSNKNMEVSSSQDNSFEEDSSEATEEDNMDNDERSKRDHKRMVKTGTPSFWPHDILSNPDVIQSAVHNKITPTALVDITRSFIKATSGDLSKVNLSYTSSWRYRNETLTDIT